MDSSKIISVIGAKGGTGQTSLAINLAYNLSKKINKNQSLVFIDLNFNQPDACVMLNIKPKNNLLDLLKNHSSLDKEIISSCCYDINNQFKVILPSTEILIYKPDKPQIILDTLNKIKEYFDFVILDLPKIIDETLIRILDISNHIILNSDSTVESIINSIKWEERFIDLAYNQQKIIYLFNKTNKLEQHATNSLNSKQIYKISISSFKLMSQINSLYTGQAKTDLDKIANLFCEPTITKNYIIPAFNFFNF